MSKFAQEHPNVVKIISGITIGLGTVAVAMTVVAGATIALKAVISAITAFGAAVNISLGIIGWVTIGIIALITTITALKAVFEDVEEETTNMTTTTRTQYYELQDLNTEYEEAYEKYGETSEKALRLKYQVDDLSNAFEENGLLLQDFQGYSPALA